MNATQYYIWYSILSMACILLCMQCTYSFRPSINCAKKIYCTVAKGTPCTSSCIRKTLQNNRQFLRQTCLSASKKRNLEELIYSPPNYLVKLLQKEPNRRRWTVTDVTQSTGTELSRVEQDIMAFAILTGAQLEVTQQGTILYTFPKDIDKVLRDKSIRHRIDGWMARIFPYVNHVYRISFGIMLLSSLALVYVAFVVASSSNNSDDDSDSKNDNSPRHHRSRSRHHHRQQQPGIQLHIDVFDLLYLFDRRNMMYNQQYNNTQNLSFLRAIYSFLFGDGDPNQYHENQVLYPAVVKYIQARKGFVTAEELAMFLPQLPSPPEKQNKNSNDNDSTDDMYSNVSESYVLPWLLRYAGKPYVVDDQILYHFPDLVLMNQLASQTTRNNNNYNSYNNPNSKLFSRPILQNEGIRDIFTEKDVQALMEQVPLFTRATPAQITQILGLGVANFVGILWLGQYFRQYQQRQKTAFMLLSSSAKMIPPQLEFWRVIQVCYPLLAVYSVAFLATPLVRYVKHREAVQGVVDRNNRRKEWLALLHSPTQTLWKKWQLRRKLLSEQNESKNTENDDEIVFDTFQSDALSTPPIMP